MIGKARQYKWLNFTDSVQVLQQHTSWYSYIIQDNVRNTPLRTETYDRANFHWWYSSETLAWARLFTFTWKVIGTNKSNRDTARSLLVNAIKPEWNPNIQNRWFYDLLRKTDWWEDRTCKAKVYSMPNPTNWLDSPFIDYTFDLYCENEKVYDPTTQIVTWWRWYFWWQTLRTRLPSYLSWFNWYIPVTNNWDWYAPIKVQIVWQATNPQIINLTNGNRYRITWITTNMVLDNRNLLNNPTETLIVTDNWQNIKALRHSWADIFLNPWLNNIVVLTDNITETPTVYITYRHTFIF